MAFSRPHRANRGSLRGGEEPWPPREEAESLDASFYNRTRPLVDRSVRPDQAVTPKFQEKSTNITINEGHSDRPSRTHH